MSKFIFLLFLLCFVIIYSPCDALNCEGCVPLGNIDRYIVDTDRQTDRQKERKIDRQ